MAIVDIFNNLINWVNVACMFMCTLFIYKEVKKNFSFKCIFLLFYIFHWETFEYCALWKLKVTQSLGCYIFLVSLDQLIMNSHNIGWQQRSQQNHELDVYDYESEQIVAQKKVCHRGVLEAGTPTQSFIDHANSSSTIMSYTGSPTSAFYATEICMGLPQVNYQVGSSTFSPDISKNYDAQMTSYQQQSENGFCSESLEQTNRWQGDSCNYQYRFDYQKSYSERDQLLQLKRKLLGNFDSPDNRRQVSIPFSGNSDISVSCYLVHLLYLK